MPRTPRAVGHDAEDGPEEHEPVDGVHAKARVKTVSATTTATKTANTNP